MRIQGYLTQSKLEQLLKEISGTGWLGNELRVLNSRRRWDMAFKFDSKTFIVEYDGDEHYRNSIKIKTDIEKDEVARKLGYTVVRIPYWIQIDSKMLNYYFGINKEIEQDFPQGFISTKIFPASFCEKGIERFQNELNNLPIVVKTKVLQSLKARIEKYGIDYVLPSSLHKILD